MGSPTVLYELSYEKFKQAKTSFGKVYYELKKTAKDKQLYKN